MSDLRANDFVNASAELADSIASFHERFDVTLLEHRKPEEVTQILQERISIFVEELGEHAKEVNKGNWLLAAQEMADIAFVALGTLEVMGLTGAVAMRSIAEKNNAKTHETHEFNYETGKILRKQKTDASSS